MSLDDSLLGKTVKYNSEYDPSLLFPILRAVKRLEIGIGEKLPFDGVDIWHAYELSWLNDCGKPEVAIGRFYFDAGSEFIIESKSFKLYLNSFNNTKFSGRDKITEVLARDLSSVVCCDVKVELLAVDQAYSFAKSWGVCIDHADIDFPHMEDVDKTLLKPKNLNEVIDEKLYSNLFKSNCLVTSQPDWATIFIEYIGSKIDHTDLLRYLVSYRNHSGFHEQCVERVYMDLLNAYDLRYLSVYAKYTRRGGLDIWPYRATSMTACPDLNRTSRQ